MSFLQSGTGAATFISYCPAVWESPNTLSRSGVVVFLPQFYNGHFEKLRTTTTTGIAGDINEILSYCTSASWNNAYDMDQQPTASDAVSSVEKQELSTPPPPEPRFGGWMPTVTLTGLCITFLASTSGIIVSILYLAKKIAANDNPMLSIAQSFMLFASILSMAYIGYHIRATRAGNTLYGILDSQGRKTLHPVHARTRMLIISATSVWVLTIILLAVGIYFGGGGSKAVLLNMDLFASVMASLSLSIECYVVFRVDRPFLLPWLSPWDARTRPRRFDSEGNPIPMQIVPMDGFARGFDPSILERGSSPARSATPKNPTHVSLPPSPTPSRPGGPRPMMPAKSDSILSGSTLHDGQSVHGVSGPGYTLPKPPPATYQNTEPQRIGPEAPVLQTPGHNYSNSAEIFTNVPLSPTPYLTQNSQPWNPQSVVTQTSPTMTSLQAPHPPPPPVPNMTYAEALQQQQQQQQQQKQQPGHYYQQHPQHHQPYQPYSPQQYQYGPHPQVQHAPTQQPSLYQHQYQYPPSQSPTQWAYPQQPAAVYGTAGPGNISPMSTITDYRDANSEPVSPITRQNSGMSAQVRSMPGTFRDGG
ncbi:hypothetical protein SMACR_03156 [Sordaria macrospora]|uniref:Uncharacterized protein n=1 Tax=Sordaria macrospora TaxID=5147 RepID=A0A8S8ZXV5_SORMA|nr:hypothetical protein SMACR_03156 [Sordaria macrospora]WPJ60726.1 hypothetical protein SMAC4_03156 [Sordaria macrospora]